MNKTHYSQSSAVMPEICVVPTFCLHLNVSKPSLVLHSRHWNENSLLVNNGLALPWLQSRNRLNRICFIAVKYGFHLIIFKLPNLSICMWPKGIMQLLDHIFLEQPKLLLWWAMVVWATHPCRLGSCDPWEPRVPLEWQEEDGWYNLVHLAATESTCRYVRFHWSQWIYSVQRREGLESYSVTLKWTPASFDHFFLSHRRLL